MIPNTYRLRESTAAVQATLSRSSPAETPFYNAVNGQAQAILLPPNTAPTLMNAPSQDSNRSLDDLEAGVALPQSESSEPDPIRFSDLALEHVVDSVKTGFTDGVPRSQRALVTILFASTLVFGATLIPLGITSHNRKQKAANTLEDSACNLLTQTQAACVELDKEQHQICETITNCIPYSPLPNSPCHPDIVETCELPEGYTSAEICLASDDQSTMPSEQCIESEDTLCNYIADETPWGRSVNKVDCLGNHDMLLALLDESNNAGEADYDVFAGITAGFASLLLLGAALSISSNRNVIQANTLNYLRNPEELGRRLIEVNDTQPSLYAYADINTQKANEIERKIDRALKDAPRISYARTRREIQNIFNDMNNESPLSEQAVRRRMIRMGHLIDTDSHWTASMCKVWTYLNTYSGEALGVDLKRDFVDFLASSEGCAHGRESQILLFFDNLRTPVSPSNDLDLKHVKSILYLDKRVQNEILAEMRNHNLPRAALKKLYVGPSCLDKVSSFVSSNARLEQDTPQEQVQPNALIHGQMGTRLFNDLAQVLDRYSMENEQTSDDTSIELTARPPFLTSNLQKIQQRQQFKADLYDRFNDIASFLSPADAAKIPLKDIVDHAAQNIVG